MDTNSILFILTLIIVPTVVSIIANLLTPYPAMFLADRSRKKAQNYVTKNIAFIRELEEYQKSPAGYSTFMLNKLLRIAVEWSAFFLFGGLAIAVAWLLFQPNELYPGASDLWGVLVWLWVVFILFVVLQNLVKLVRDLMVSHRVLTGMNDIKAQKLTVWSFVDNTMRKHPDWLADIDIPEDIWKDYALIKKDVERRLEESNALLASLKGIDVDDDDIDAKQP